MLSKVENEFLKSPESFDANYAYVLKHRIRGKAQALQGELALLHNAGFLTENCNDLTDFCKVRQGQQSPNQASLKEWLVRSPGFEPGIASLEGLCPKPARRRPLGFSATTVF